MPDPERDVSDAPWQRRAVVLCVVAYLALASATAWVWEPTHDEGVAWRQAIGPTSLPPADSPAPIARLYETLDGNVPHGPRDVLDALMVKGGMHPPAYYLLIHAWTFLAGTSRLVLSIPAFAFGVLALFGIARLSRRLIRAATAPIWSMALLATSPWFVGFSTLAKPYAITICLSIWGANALLALHQDPTRAWRWRVLFVGVSTLGLYAIYHYAFVLAWQGIFALVLAWQREDRGREVLRVAAMGAAIFVLFAPWIPRLLTHLEISAADAHYFTGSVPIAEWPALALGVVRIWGLGEALRAPASGLLVAAWALLAAITAIALVASFRRGSPGATRPEDRDARLFLACLPLLPLAIIAGDAWRETHTLFISKLSFGLFPLGIVAIVRAGHASANALMRRGLLFAWLTLFALASVASVESRARAITPFEAVAAAIAVRDQPDHLVIFSSRTPGYLIPMVLTLRDAGIENVRVAHSTADDLWRAIEKARTDPNVARLTLVDLAVTYRTQDMWLPRRMHALGVRAAQAGWHVGHLSPGVDVNGRTLPIPRFADDLPPVGAKTLLLCELTNVKYYSMEVAGNPDAIKVR